MVGVKVLHATPKLMLGALQCIFSLLLFVLILSAILFGVEEASPSLHNIVGPSEGLDALSDSREF
uniref:Uncharacterized protein n=1 Tax=Romanomermis culicivorax TaxID=13658 RepID=A0A915KLH4_ROMCU